MLQQQALLIVDIQRKIDECQAVVGGLHLPDHLVFHGLVLLAGDSGFFGGHLLARAERSEPGKLLGQGDRVGLRADAGF